MNDTNFNFVVWLDEFKSIHGRPLRVLHVDNIANNAYINAKIMRLYGIEADVVCNDYYHIMGCPEWEDAEFEGEIKNQNFPDWWSVNLKEFKRPRWFVQGPPKKVINFLLIKNSKYFFLSPIMWWLLELDRWCLCCEKRRARITHILLKYFSILPRKACSMLKKVHGVNKKILNLIKKFFINKLPEEKDCYISTPAYGCLKPLIKDDVQYHLRNIKFWKKLFDHYDIIQGYAISGILPLLANSRFTAYEHGTIRDIPFEDNVLGRICSVVYKKAESVFVTNQDCLKAAERLNIPNERTIPLPHAFDSNRAFKFFKEHRGRVKIEVKPVTFIAPARHHWLSGNTSWLKGNDTIIQAAKLLDNKRLNFKIIFINWGLEVDKSRSLIEELKITHCFEWVEPMVKSDLWMQYLSSAAVIDQFVVPAMGGVSFEALAFGRPLLTKLDVSVAEKFFGKSPPLYNAWNPQELAEHMSNIIADPYDKIGVGQKAQEWIKQYHSAERILELQLSAYHKILNNSRSTTK